MFNDLEFVLIGGFAMSSFICSVLAIWRAPRELLAVRLSTDRFMVQREALLDDERWKRFSAIFGVLDKTVSKLFH